MTDYSNHKTKKSFLRKGLEWISFHCLPNTQKIKKISRDNEHLRVLYRDMPQASIFWYTDSNALTISPEILSWFGLDQINNLTDLIDYFSAEDRANIHKSFTDFQRDRIAFNITAATHQGQFFHIKGTNSQNGEQKIQAVWFYDITEQHQHVLASEKERIATEKTLVEIQEAMSALPFPVWIRDQSNNLIWVNKSYAHATEDSVDHILKEQIELLSSKGNLGRNMAMRALNERTSIQERHHVIINGNRSLYEVVETKLPNTNKTLGHGLDVTPMEDMESEMRRFKASTSELLRSLNTGIAIFNPEQELTFYNDAYCDLFHLEENWLDQKPTLGEIMEMCRDKRRLPEQANFKLYKNKWLEMFISLIGPSEDMMHLPDGTAIRMLVVPHPLGGLFMTFEDVTSRLELESSYNTLIAVQRETLDNLAEGLAVFGSDGRLQLYNPTYTKIWGLKKRDLNRTPHISRLVEQKKPLFEDKDWESVRDELMNSGISREEKNGRIKLNDGRVLEYVTVPLPDGGMLNRFSDVTDTLRVEQALRDKNAALEEAERLKLDFLANVSYQLRTPLNAMLGFAEVLEKEYFGPLNERQKEYASGMLDAGEKMISLVNDILDLSTIEAGYLELQIQPLDIQKMLNTIYELTQEWARKQDITLKLVCNSSIGKMEADERRLKQVLLNLTSNAIKFTPAKGTITISAVKQGPKIHLSVSDTGEGIPKEDQDRIFGPFVQTKQRNVGAGLGLSLVKSIVELHNGEVTLQSEEGKGTTITCILPLKTRLNTHKKPS